MACNTKSLPLLPIRFVLSYLSTTTLTPSAKFVFTVTPTEPYKRTQNVEQRHHIRQFCSTA